MQDLLGKLRVRNPGFDTPHSLSGVNVGPMRNIRRVKQLAPSRYRVLSSLMGRGVKELNTSGLRSAQFAVSKEGTYPLDHV